ncbi:MAG TPA: M13 family metallopeptidase N-terminal domain-containing protein, partial [Saprospiraceae bacterium]|nr:M13 family metallopeptidase N-terminal domain-containing protein [Saprospiraceae bacterium]
MTPTRSFLLFAIAGTIFTACNNNADKSTKTDFLAANLDTTVSPGEDFFLYANGGWIKKTPIPAAESAWGVGYLVQEDIYLRLKKINDDAAAKKSSDGTIDQKIGDFWYSGMDTVTIEKQGLSPLQADLDKINNIKTVNDLISVAADFHTKRIRVMFADFIGQDDKNSESMMYQLNQGGLGMPNRDYYFNTDSRTEGVRKAYKEYLVKTFKQLGNDSVTAVKNAKSVFDLETRLAKSSRKLAALRDPERNYNKMALDNLNKLS